MLTFLPTFIRLPLVCLLVALNLLLHVTPLFLFAIIKAIVPIKGFRRVCSRILVLLAEDWIAVHSVLMRIFTRTEWQVEGLDGLRYRGWYLVLSNHQSWVDIPVLQKIFNKRIPFLKFFLKQQLIWVPVLGVAWWALDFPFMRRYSRATLKKHPELAGKDMQETRKACERFRDLPVSVMNFVEGTRFTDEKHSRQQSPYAHLLKPKSGGAAFVLDSMGEILQSVIDVTIVYPDGRPTLVDLLAGRVRKVCVVVRELPIPAEIMHGDYENNPSFRAQFQQWVNSIWKDKDTIFERID
jgi:1-acyl-sn-glycerol-3-phosphate acyltransferase